MHITKCAPSAPTADFADSVRTRVIMSLASWGGRNGAVVPRGDERQPSQDGGDWHNIDDRLLRLIQQLRPALTGHPPPGEDSPVH